MARNQEESPCHGCGERVPGCHGSCEKWRRAQEIMGEKKAKILAVKKEQGDLYVFHSECVRRTIQKVYHSKR